MWLGRGINVDGLDERLLDAVAAAGFDTVRLPVTWSRHADEAPPYTIEEPFFERVDRAIAGALARDLNVVANVHHYDALSHAPDRHAARFLALWEQIAPRYAGHPDRLCFELLNEPHDAMTAERWNDLLPRALAIVRRSNPSRAVIAGPARWNIVGALPALALPPDDDLIVTVHYYSPFAFTHQGAGWVEGADRWLGSTWGSDADREVVRQELAAAASWATQRGVPLFLGEFGVYSRVEMAARARWTAHVRTEAERLGMSWAYWDCGGDFGAFDPRRGAWREPLRRALL